MIRWDPSSGKIFAREIWTNGKLSCGNLGLILQARQKRKDSLKYLQIMRYDLMSNQMISTPKNGDVFYDFMEYTEEYLEAFQNCCVKRYALSDELLINLIRHWDKKFKPDEWLSWIKQRLLTEEKLISDEEYQRLDLVLTQIFGHPLNRK